MERIAPFCFALMMVVLLAAPARAEIKAATYSVTPFLGGYTFEGNEELKTRPVFGLRFGYDFTPHWGTEGAVDFVRTESSAAAADADVYGYRWEGLYHFLPQNRLVPFLAAGIGGRSLRYNRLLDDRNHLLVDYGAGLKYFLTERLALRADVRHLFLPNDSINNLEYTVGLTYYFGTGARPTAAPVDSDGDGIYDDLDMCPGTPAGVAVDKDGCPLDTDKDGVPDYLDKCPDTLIGVDVDQNGCPPREKMRKAMPAAPVTVERRKEPEAATIVAREMLEKGRATINIEFDFDKAEIKPLYHGEIKKFADVMTQYPQLHVVLEGHTDSVGRKAYNQKLSERRADSVKDYLVKTFGIAASRLTTKGYGQTKPIASNKTAAGRKKNRRVEAAVDYTIKQ